VSTRGARVLEDHKNSSLVTHDKGPVAPLLKNEELPKPVFDNEIGVFHGYFRPTVGEQVEEISSGFQNNIVNSTESLMGRWGDGCDVDVHCAEELLCGVFSSLKTLGQVLYLSISRWLIAAKKRYRLRPNDRVWQWHGRGRDYGFKVEPVGEGITLTHFHFAQTSSIGSGALHLRSFYI
jgi:hypothetical protein